MAALLREMTAENPEDRITLKDAMRAFDVIMLKFESSQLRNRSVQREITRPTIKVESEPPPNPLVPKA